MHDNDRLILVTIVIHRLYECMLSHNSLSGHARDSLLINQHQSHCLLIHLLNYVSLFKSVTPHSTQNRSFGRRSSQPISWLVLKELNLTLKMGLFNFTVWTLCHIMNHKQIILHLLAVVNKGHDGEARGRLWEWGGRAINACEVMIFICQHISLICAL